MPVLHHRPRAPLLWLFDFEIRSIGTVVQQRIWAPQNEAQRHGHAPLNMPIFFVLNDRRHTRPADRHRRSARPHDAARRGHPAPVGECSTTFIRINVAQSHPFMARALPVPGSLSLSLLT
jgi:hypothetical protein